MDIRSQFRGLNTDLDPLQTPSGTADIAVNVTVRPDLLAKRGGIGVLSSAVASGAVVNLFAPAFADGTVYLVAKVGATLYRRQVYPTDAGSFTAITGGQTHNASDRGWGFLWHDRFHYFDRAGGSRWNPAANSGVAYKAGIIRPTTGPVLEAASGGLKDGWYHVWMAYRNAVTHEEGIVCSPNATPIECRTETNTGGIYGANWATIKVADANYEWHDAVFYSSCGNTEGEGIDGGPPRRSWRGYIDVVLSKTADVEGPGLNKADSVLNPREFMRNSGGEPPGSLVGCFDGSRAFYGGIYESAALVPARLEFSLPGFPTMVPREVTYSVGGDSRTFRPHPWTGRLATGLPGPWTGIASGSGVVVAFTPTSSHQLIGTPEGRVRPRVVHPTLGCAGPGLAAGSPHGIFARGHGSLLHVRGEAWADLSYNRLRTLLGTIPASYATVGATAYYGYREEIWCAFAPAGQTTARKVLVYSVRDDAFWVVEPACLAAGEGITAMCEMAYPGAEPVMLLATTAGRILKYPYGTDDAGENFAADWRGYFGQEGAYRDQQLADVRVHCGPEVAGNVTMGLRSLRTGGEEVSQKTTTLKKSSAVDKPKVQLDPIDANLFQIEFSSTSSTSAAWSIRGLSLRVRGT